MLRMLIRISSISFKCDFIRIDYLTRDDYDDGGDKKLGSTKRKNFICFLFSHFRSQPLISCNGS